MLFPHGVWTDGHRYGMVFDIIECLIQRNFSYATQDIRDAYALVKKDLLDPDNKKVVFICHSQGGIEGSLVVDWLIDELPCDILNKLEVYTFGSAANHFNNPYKSSGRPPSNIGASPEIPRAKCLRHIEHYANEGDLVCRWGIINFARIPNRYVGQVFVRPGKGHQMVQHYLDTMFLTGPDKRMLDTNEFMEMEVEVPPCRGCGRTYWGRSTSTPAVQPDGHNGISEGLLSVEGAECTECENKPGRKKVKELSRLWLYRNGQSPVN